MTDRTYTVHEVADLASHREGTEIKVRDLTSAKRTARRLQMYQNTTMVIRRDGALLAYREPGSRWIDCHQSISP